IYYGKFEAPIRAIIESEIERGEAEKSLLSTLFNVEKSDRYAETIMAQSGFSTFRPKREGEIAQNDEFVSGYPKIIEHIEFAKEFAITRKMVDDSQNGLCSEMKREPKAFATSYVETKLELASYALANGMNGTMNYNGIDVDLKTGDGKPLFSKEHTNKAGKKQSNLFSNVFSVDDLYKLVVAFRNIKDDNGKTLGVSPDVIVIPGNRADLEKKVVTLFSSMQTPGGNTNDANPFYKKMEVVVNPFWQSNDDSYILMSTKLNERLMGNMFFNRVDLDIINEVDRKTRNLVWNGYCRFGIGFGSWKHALMAGVTGGTVIA
ncbi:MAG: Mu-like prophage major head subunit gpT family protein, partial [Clostridia bacterium]